MSENIGKTINIIIICPLHSAMLNISPALRVLVAASAWPVETVETVGNADKIAAVAGVVAEVAHPYCLVVEIA